MLSVTGLPGPTGAAALAGRCGTIYAATDLQPSHAARAYTQALPRSRRVVQALGQTGQPLALVTGSSPRARLARRGAVKHRIEAQGGNQAHLTCRQACPSSTTL